MNITWLEMKKALTSPMVLTLLVLMLGWNVFLIVSDSHDKKELTVATDIINTYGVTFNDETLKTMEHDILAKLEQLGIKSTEAFYEEMTYERYSTNSRAEQEQIDEVRILLSYFHYAQIVDERYKGIDLNSIKMSFYKSSNVPNWLQSYFDKQFSQWDERLTEILATDEYKHWFFLGDYFKHSDLFRDTFKLIALEGLMLVTLITALIVNYEFEHRTQLVTYATKRGRKLLLNKIVASIMTSGLALVVLFTVTLGTYFIVYDYSAIWQTVVSSGFNWEYKLPYITWWKIPYWLYFVLALAIVGAVLLLAVFITIVISIFVKNSYYTWLICLIGFLAMFVVPSFFTGGGILWLMHYNLTLLLLNAHNYFNGGDSFMMEKYHELWTLLLWTVLVSTSILLAIRHFNRKDVV